MPSAVLKWSVIGTGTVIGVLLIAALSAWWIFRGPDIPYEALEQKYAGSASHFVDLPGALRVHYRDEGAATAPVVLLLHGFGDSFTSWDGWLPVLSKAYRVLAPDFPGHGLTRAPLGYSLANADLAQFVDDFARALNLGPVIVAGNSMGGGVAWQLAVQHPERVRALVLVDAAGFIPDEKPSEQPLAFKILRYPWGRYLLSHIDNRPLIEQGLKFDVADPAVISPEFVDRWAAFQRAPGHRAILMTVVLGAARWDAAKAPLDKIAVPTLILHGESDRLLPLSGAQRFARAIPGSTLHTYPDVGHLPQIEIPEKSALDVAAFLDASIH